MTKTLVLDGTYGEGGGQIVRTALALASITGQPIHIHGIRAGRRNPGLAAQHVTAVRAAASICQARVSGDALGSQELEFAPQRPPQAGRYAFDVAAAREGGSAGAAILVIQTVLPPLAVAAGESEVVVDGGTHMPWSPPFDYARDVWLPALADLGIDASLELLAWGWFPVGGGRVRAVIRGKGHGTGAFSALDRIERGPLIRIAGRAIAANLPAHIPQRMADRARSVLAPAGAEIGIIPERVRAACPGAGIFLTAEYATMRAGFSAFGAIGKPSDQVADEAAASLLRHHASGAALDAHLADQILLPLGVASSPSAFSAERVSRHLETNAWVIEQFGIARVLIDRMDDGTGRVTVTPAM